MTRQHMPVAYIRLLDMCLGMKWKTPHYEFSIDPDVKAKRPKRRNAQWKQEVKGGRK